MRAEAAVWLGASLATHRRGGVLHEAASARPMPPDLEVDGISLLFGFDFQNGDEPFQQRWLSWSQSPGRTLLLLPPFEELACRLPMAWETQRRSAPRASNVSSWIQSLALEVRFVLLGALRTLPSAGGAWDDLTPCTGYFRKHPHAGIFAVTCLPLWSLATLDRPKELREWLETLHRLSGDPIQTGKAESQAFSLRPDHYTFLLHLLTGPYSDAGEALAGLRTSSILSLAPDRATSCQTELEAHGLAMGGEVTKAGRELLRESPYSAFAEAMESMTR